MPQTMARDPSKEEAVAEPTMPRVVQTRVSTGVGYTPAGVDNSHLPQQHGSIDRKSPIPLYYQLYRLLLDKLENGEWKPGDLIPSEKELSEQHGLSRITIRQTLQLLVTDGLLHRERGRGTFVAAPKVQRGPEGTSGITGYLHAQGYQAGWRLVSMERVMPPKRVKENLKLGDEEMVLEIRRFRLADDVIIGWHRAFVPYPLADQIKQEYLVQGESSLHYLEECLNLPLRESNRTIGAIPAGEEEAELLGVEIGFPLLIIRRTTLSADGRPVEYLRSVYRGDRFEYQLHLEYSSRPRR